MGSHLSCSTRSPAPCPARSVVIALFSLSGQLAILFLLYLLFYFFTFSILFHIFGMYFRKSAETPGKQSFFTHQEKCSVLWNCQNPLHFPFCNYTFSLLELAHFTFFTFLLFLLFLLFSFEKSAITTVGSPQFHIS